MALSWMLGWRKEGEKQRTINEIRECKSKAYKEYARKEYPFRILSSLYIFSIVVILGVIAYEKRVVTYRSHFPEGEEKTNVSISIEVSLVATDSSLDGIAEEVRKYVDKSFEGRDQPLPVTIKGTVNRLGTRPLSSLLSDVSSSSSLDLFIALVPSKEWPHFSATSIFLTKGKWTLVQIRDGEESSKVLTRVEHLIFDVLIGIPHLELIVKRDKRERIEPWIISTMSPEHQKRLTWDCNALSSSYSIRLVHIHSSCVSSSSLTSTIHPTLLPSINRFASLIEDVSTLNITSQHIFDLDLSLFLELDVQGRQTINQDKIHLLLREIDTFVSPTQSTDPQLKLIIIHSDKKLMIVDGEGDDVSGVSVSEWGAIIVNDNQVTTNLISSLRMLLGIDSHLPPTFKRDSVPISQWELTRLSIRKIVDSSLRAKHSIRALRSLVNNIDNLVFSNDLASLISSSISSLSCAFSNTRMPSLSELNRAVRNAESALMDSSLLSLLYFPTEQKFGIFLPLIALYFAPALFLLPRIIHFCIFRD